MYSLPHQRCTSGGKAQAEDSQPTAAEDVRDYLARQGVESGDLVVEADSRTTYENILNCRQLFEAQGIRKIVLVTEAVHLHRAVG